MGERITTGRPRKVQKVFRLMIPLSLCLFLCACSNSAGGKSEKDVVADLQASEEYISPAAAINDYEIIKRQTDKENKSDMVYLTVHSSGQNLDCTLSYVMQYELYNDGWILESVNRYYDGPWEFSGIEEERLVSDIDDYDYYFTDWDLDIQNLEVISEGYNSNASTLYEKTFSIDLSACYPGTFDYNASYNLFYEIKDGEWMLQSVDMITRKYAPLYSPNQGASDAIMESLEMDIRQGDGITYDNYEYLRTDKDWENCQEVRCYTASKTWFYGTETFLIKIPITFSIENGDTHWSYDSSKIVHDLQEVNWSLSKEWSCDYGDASKLGWHAPLNGYAVAELRINQIIPTADPAVYNVDLYCNGYSTEYSSYVHAESGQLATLKYDGGHWSLSIEKSEDLGAGKIWYGGFSLYGYENSNRQGVYWNCTRDGVKLKEG